MSHPSPTPSDPSASPSGRRSRLGRILVVLASAAIATAVVGSVVIALRFIQMG